MKQSKKSFPEIVELGQPVLRKKAKIVANIKDSEVQGLIDDLLSLVQKVEGVGMAGPQLEKSLRVFVLASHPNSRYPKAPIMKPIAILNPEIISLSGIKEKDWEGCLSVPGIRGLVPRYPKIKVKYQNRFGTRQMKIFEGFVARIFQHEYDHLEGMVFLDRVENTKDLVTEKEYQRIISLK